MKRAIMLGGIAAATVGVILLVMGAVRLREAPSPLAILDGPGPSERPTHEPSPEVEAARAAWREQSSATLTRPPGDAAALHEHLRERDQAFERLREAQAADFERRRAESQARFDAASREMRQGLSASLEGMHGRATGGLLLGAGVGLVMLGVAALLAIWVTGRREAVAG
jgi:hypothetical protein